MLRHLRTGMKASHYRSVILAHVLCGAAEIALAGEFAWLAISTQAEQRDVLERSRYTKVRAA